MKKNTLTRVYARAYRTIVAPRRRYIIAIRAYSQKRGTRVVLSTTDLILYYNNDDNGYHRRRRSRRH